jgi:hypothetical protein
MGYNNLYIYIYIYIHMYVLTYLGWINKSMVGYLKIGDTDELEILFGVYTI